MNIKKGIRVGTRIPMTQKNGNVGRCIEDILEAFGNNVSRNCGVDLPEDGLEVKTRNESATSPQTIGSMSHRSIVDTPWHQSPIRNKVQKQYRVKYKESLKHHDESIITSEQVYDFTFPEIQDKLKQAYEFGREYLSEFSPGEGPNCTPISGQWGYFEQQADGQYQFRVSDKTMKKMESIASSHSTGLFES